MLHHSNATILAKLSDIFSLRCGHLNLVLNPVHTTVYLVVENYYTQNPPTRVLSPQLHNVLNFPYSHLLSTEPRQRTSFPRLSTSDVFANDRQRIPSGARHYQGTLHYGVRVPFLLRRSLSSLASAVHMP